LKSILSSVSAVKEVSPSRSKINSTPFKSVGDTVDTLLVLSLITYIVAPLAGAAVKVILFISLLPSTPNVNAFPEPGSCLTLFTKTSNAFSPPFTTGFCKSKVVVDPSPVKLSLLGTGLKVFTGSCPLLNYLHLIHHSVILICFLT
jgi:hypothetical protein